MKPIRLGLRENLAQFSLLVVVNAFVGAMVGMERSILPAIAEGEFRLAARTAILSFIVVFGVTKALTNYFAGRWSDRFGRKHVLVAGWLVAIPVPFLLMWAPSWSWILGANALLGISQGLTWSTTVIMKIDLAGPRNRGLAMGLNEFAGYFAVALSALATGFIAAEVGLRPEPFYLGVGFVVLGTLLSAFAVRETRHHVDHESKLAGNTEPRALSQREVITRTSFTDPDLSSVSQAGMVNNLNDGMAWGLFPLVFAAAGMSLGEIGTLAAAYPAVWGLAQLFTGAWSDHVGRKGLIVAGMWTQALGIVVIAVGSTFALFATGAVLLGLGTAMVYPTLLAAIGDVAHPSWRASAVGVYRLWRDMGYAVGALLAGVVADAFGLSAATLTIAALTFASGVVVAFRMRETLRRESLLLSLVAILLASSTSGCKSDHSEPTKVELSVFAASSLTEAYRDLERGFEDRHPDVDVKLTFAGSQVLRLQIEEGASVDVFASANESHMQALVDSGHVASSRVFARNELVVIVPKSNPAGIDTFADLEKASRIVLGTDNVPVGIYTRQVLDRARGQIGGAFVDAVERHAVSEESNVRLVRAKVEMGEADAAVVYRTDAASSDRVRTITIPEELNVRASYPIGTMTRAAHRPEAERFIDYVLSTAGRAILRRHGFVASAE